jgi:CHAD domain-containing protein
MPKPRVIEALTPELRVRRAARLILSARLEEVLACEAATRAGDPEAGVHDMRVAMKRLRESLRLFRKVYPRPALDPYLEKLEALNDALGQVRDRDVMQVHLRELRRGERLSAGLRRLLDQLAAERQGAFVALLALLDQLAAEDFQHHLQAFFMDGRRPGKKGVAGQALGDFVRARLARCLQSLQASLPALANEADSEGLHRARIAEKKLRYRLEPFLTLMGKPVQRAYPILCQFHDALGDVHDCDLLRPLLAQHADTLPPPQQVPLHRLLARLESRRHERYGQLQALLQEQVPKALADLARAVKS